MLRDFFFLFIPALGMVSAIVQACSRRPVVGYTAVVLSLIATGYIGFGATIVNASANLDVSHLPTVAFGSRDPRWGGHRVDHY
jgi:hypothetical protein